MNICDMNEMSFVNKQVKARICITYAIYNFFTALEKLDLQSPWKCLNFTMKKVYEPWKWDGGINMVSVSGAMRRNSLSHDTLPLANIFRTKNLKAHRWSRTFNWMTRTPQLVNLLKPWTCQQVHLLSVCVSPLRFIVCCPTAQFTVWTNQDTVW